jgi:hypothetical protein
VNNNYDKFTATTIQCLSLATVSGGFKQVADKSLFIGLIRTKINKNSKEIERFQSEKESKNHEQVLQIYRWQKLIESTEDVSKSESQLSDHNFLKNRRYSNKI